ncbi:MAG: hypothetical protein ACTSRG_23525, partial [Candidatus Helarchaeota archaeon]
MNDEERQLRDFLNYKPEKAQDEKDSNYMKEKSGGSGMNFLEISKGENRVRFLPPRDPSSGSAYVRVKKHYLRVTDDEGNEKSVSITCTGDDLGCRAVKYLQSLGGKDNLKLAKDIRSKENVYFIAYDRDYEKNCLNKGKDIEMSRAVGVVRASYTLANRIIGGLKLDLDAFHPLKGRDFIIYKDTSRKYPDYSSSQYDLKSSPLSKSKDILLEILRAIPDLSKLTSVSSEKAEEAYRQALSKLVDIQAMEEYEAKLAKNEEEFDASEIVSESEMDDFFDNQEHKEVSDVEINESAKKNDDEDDIGSMLDELM